MNIERFVFVKVLSAVQSPMNKLRWVLELDCGHEIWVTQRSKPKARAAKCHKCGELHREIAMKTVL